MTPIEYTALAARTQKSFPQGMDLTSCELDVLHATLGIAGESGELTDAVKKSIIYSRPLDVVNIIEELGDILWYIALMAKALETPIEKIMELNIQKLTKRYPQKYTDELAAKRLDKQETGETK